MQMLEDAIAPDELDVMRKIFKPEMERDDAEHAREIGRRLAARRDAAEEGADRNRHERRKAAALAGS